MVRTQQSLEVRVLGEDDWLRASEVCELCRLELAVVMELAELGVVAPRAQAAGEWQLPATALPRLRIAARLMHDLGVNVSGAALALELLDARRDLERRLRTLERLAGEY
jgi:chaperone modulatory protein CbpM